MRIFAWTALAVFNLIMGTLALTPNLGWSSQTADLLHFSVSAINVLSIGVLKPRYLLAVSVVMLAGGILAEVLQTSIAGREGSIDDLAMDAAGIVCGAAIAFLVPARAPRTPARVSPRFGFHGDGATRA